MAVNRSGLDGLYQQLIIDHARFPQGKGLTDPFTAESFQVNPVCGDRVRLRVHLAADDAARLERVSWDGQGCSISQASISVMAGLVEGLAVAEAEAREAWFVELMHARGQGIDDGRAVEALGDAVAFEGVARFPARIKCALLGWMALRDALTKAAAGDGSAALIPEGIE